MDSASTDGPFQITVPLAVRRQLGIKRGDRLLIGIRGEHVILMREPADYVAALAGLHAEVWEGVDAREYVRRERETWGD